MTEYLVDVTVAHGKYTVRQDLNGHLYALRHGEPWSRRLVRDKLVLALAQEAARLREQLAPPAFTMPPPPNKTCFVCHAKMDVPYARFLPDMDFWHFEWDCAKRCGPGCGIVFFPPQHYANDVTKEELEQAGFTIVE